MTRRAMLRFTQAVPLVMVPTAFTKDESFVISYGRVGGTELEQAEGYFEISEGTMVMVQPNSSGHQRLKALKGKAVSLIVRVDE